MTTTMNTLVKGIEVDHINEVIRMTKSFSKLAQNPKTPEFALFIETKRACTGYTVEVKTIETNENKESYKDLSIEKMLV